MVRYLKSGMILITAALLTGSSAQQQSDTTEVDTTGRDGAGAPRGHVSDSTMACGMMMMHMMKPSTVFETSDGFIVIVGNRIIKYDNNLNMVRQAEIPIDTTAMKEMMQRMDRCPGKQQEGNGGESDTTTNE